MPLLVQLSDLHIQAPGRRAYGRVDTARFLAEAVKAVARLPQRPDAVLITGDLTDLGRPEEFAHLRELLSPLADVVAPLYLLPGNHDDRAGLRSAFPDHPWLMGQPGSPFVQYAVDLAGLRLVVADTLVPMHSHGALCKARLLELDALLTQAPATRTMLALHHPPFITHIGHMDDMGLLEGAEALAALVRRHPQVERVVCGHLHRPIQALWAGTLAMTAPSTAHQVTLDLAPNAQPAYSLEPPGFLLHAWEEGRPMVSHAAVVGPFAGPFPFRDEGG